LKKTIIIFLLTLVISCDFIYPKKINQEELIDLKRETINWNEIDHYPSFTTCEESLKKNDSKVCFEETINRHINQFLSQQDISVDAYVKDTITLQINISKKGKISIENFKAKKDTKSLMPQLDSLFKESLKGLPAVYPAIKRGHQVNSTFSLPIFISME